MERVNHETQWISKEGVRAARKTMKRGKAIGPDCIPLETRDVKEMAVVFLTWFFNKILESERIPDEWISNVPILKNNGDAQNCSDDRGIKINNHSEICSEND